MACLVGSSCSTTISKDIFTRRQDSEKLRVWGLLRPVMPILFWLPLIYITALFEIAASPTKKARKGIGFDAHE